MKNNKEGYSIYNFFKIMKAGAFSFPIFWLLIPITAVLCILLSSPIVFALAIVGLPIVIFFRGTKILVDKQLSKEDKDEDNEGW